MTTYVFYLEMGKARIMERIDLPSSMSAAAIETIYDEWSKGKLTGAWWKEGEEKRKLGE